MTPEEELAHRTRLCMAREGESLLIHRGALGWVAAKFVMYHPESDAVTLETLKYSVEGFIAGVVTECAGSERVRFP